MAPLGIPLGGRKGGRLTAGKETDGCLAPAFDQPEPVSADPVHVGVNNGDCCGSGDHRLNRRAAFAQHVPPGLRRVSVRRRERALIAQSCM